MQTSILGYPRIGPNRELKKAVENYWKGNITKEELEKTGQEIRKSNWLLQKDSGIDIIPSNDFSFYDTMLDMSCLLGIVPERFKWNGNKIDIDLYFKLARGDKSTSAMEMTKWFDTNYHYIVPEFNKDQKFKLSSDKPFNEFKEALQLGIKTRPVIIGPVTFLKLGKARDKTFNVLDLLDLILPVYISLLKNLKELGADWIQIDEPILVCDLDENTKSAVRKTYEKFAKEIPNLNLMLTTYFGSLSENLNLVSLLPVSGLHVDLTRQKEDFQNVLRMIPEQVILSLGIVDGRNIWRTDLEKAVNFLKPRVEKRNKLIISSSCSFLHVPVDLDLEDKLDEKLKSLLSFSKQKLNEIKIIKDALLNDSCRGLINQTPTNRHLDSVQDRLKKISDRDYTRKNPFQTRQKIQRKKLQLPHFPSTTIGSFPQTQDIREARAKYKTKKISEEAYNEFLKSKIQEMIRIQEDIGLDVLVHGEPERNDMVEYFGEMFEGFAFTKNGWVQSYGSRCVKPPIIFSDVERQKPMTVEWIKYSQSLTKKPLKGMLTGPVTILQWSFVRDDQPRSETAKQIALALRDEVCDLEASGVSIIQIDEPAIREGLPLKKREWKNYLNWAVAAFKLSSSGVKDETQIHTHMCYSEFNDIIESIAEMDADVISIESSRSQMELLNAFVKFKYPNEIGPGVYDVHSPSVPARDEIKNLLMKASKVLPYENIWVNPDCGLKTRGWEETIASLKNMVSAAKLMREMYVRV